MLGAIAAAAYVRSEAGINHIPTKPFVFAESKSKEFLAVTPFVLLGVDPCTAT